LVGAAVIVGGVVTLVGDQGSLSQRTGAQSYDVSRFDAQHQGIELAWQHPLGIGPGQFEQDASYGGQPIAAHSLYIRAFAEEGILGLASLLTLVLATLIYGLRAAVRGDTVFGVGSAALLAAWCGILVHSYYVDSLQWRHAWLVAALIWVGAMRRGREREPASTTTPLDGAIPAAAGAESE
jgi:O-antigen ligase